MNQPAAVTSHWLRCVQGKQSRASLPRKTREFKRFVRLVRKCMVYTEELHPGKCRKITQWRQGSLKCFIKAIKGKKCRIWQWLKGLFAPKSKIHIPPIILLYFAYNPMAETKCKHCLMSLIGLWSLTGFTAIAILFFWRQKWQKTTRGHHRMVATPPKTYPADLNLQNEHRAVLTKTLN